MTVTIELSENLSIKIWPKLGRATIITAFRSINLTIEQLLAAVELAWGSR